MARHRSGKGNAQVSGWIVVAVITTALLVAALVTWLVGRDDEDANAAGDCPAGELEVPIATQNTALTEALLDDYLADEPRQDDRCVRPTLTTNVSEAAALIAVDSPVADDLLAAANRERAEGEPQPAFAEGVGLLSTADDPAGLEPAAVSFALGSDGDAGIAALAALAEGEQAGELLERDRDVTVEDALIDDAEAVVTTETAEDYRRPFHPIEGADKVYRVIVLQPTASSEEGEQRARTAEDLAQFAGGRYEGPEDEPRERQPLYDQLLGEQPPEEEGEGEEPPEHEEPVIENFAPDPPAEEPPAPEPEAPPEPPADEPPAEGPPEE